MRRDCRREIKKVMKELEEVMRRVADGIEGRGKTEQGQKRSKVRREEKCSEAQESRERRERGGTRSR